MFLPKTPENFGYDLDGNMTNDGRWAFTWDAENRLVKLESLASGPSGSKRRLEFEYDWQGRRIKKKVTNLDTGSVLLDNKFLYERWNLVAELNATNNALIRSYMWGLDLSGTPQGAGGVGGLLAVNDSGNGVQFVAYDGNGNVAALVKATDGTVSAQYEYGPFAEPIRVTGLMCKVNPLRFSTKFTDDESGFLYYGHRYYDPLTGRCLSRDPIAEAGGFHLYAFCANNPVRYIDAYGRDITDWTWVEPAADFSAGVADSVTMGITSWLRGRMDIDQVDYSSGLYYVGESAEFVVETTVTLGGGALRRKAVQYSGQAGRYVLEANARKGFRKAIGGARGAVRGGIVHHWNPIRQGRFPLPYKWTARSHWNITWLQDGRFLTAGQKHRFQHWYLKVLDTADVARAWSSPIRSGGNAIIQHVNVLGVQQNAMGKCPSGPDLIIEVILSANFDGYNEAYIDIPDSPEFPPLN